MGPLGLPSRCEERNSTFSTCASGMAIFCSSFLARMDLLFPRIFSFPRWPRLPNGIQPSLSLGEESDRLLLSFSPRRRSSMPCSEFGPFPLFPLLYEKISMSDTFAPRLGSNSLLSFFLFSRRVSMELAGAFFFFLAPGQTCPSEDECCMQFLPLFPPLPLRVPTGRLRCVSLFFSLSSTPQSGRSLESRDRADPVSFPFLWRFVIGSGGGRLLPFFSSCQALWPARVFYPPLFPLQQQ